MPRAGPLRLCRDSLASAAAGAVEDLLSAQWRGELGRSTTESSADAVDPSRHR